MLISATALKSLLHTEHLLIFDVTIVPVTGTAAEEVKGFIPGAFLIDFERDLCAPKGRYPHTFPTFDTARRFVEQYQVSATSNIVLYDRRGVFSSPRVYFTFKSLGITNVFVLDGGLPAWQEAGYPLASHPEPRAKQYETSAPLTEAYNYFCDAQFVLDNMESANVKIIDARSKERFLGLVPEPRSHLTRGHIPGALNLPYENLFVNGRYRSGSELKKYFEPIMPKGDILVFYCGSGVTACINALAAQSIGYKHIKIYDGSWSEWADPNLRFPVSRPWM